MCDWLQMLAAELTVPYRQLTPPTEKRLRAWPPQHQFSFMSHWVPRWFGCALRTAVHLFHVNHGDTQRSVHETEGHAANAAPQRHWCAAQAARGCGSLCTPLGGTCSALERRVVNDAELLAGPATWRHGRGGACAAAQAQAAHQGQLRAHRVEFASAGLSSQWRQRHGLQQRRFPLVAMRSGRAGQQHLHRHARQPDKHQRK